MDNPPPEHAPGAALLPTLAALVGAVFFFAGAIYAALSYGALPALMARAGEGQPFYFCH